MDQRVCDDQRLVFRPAVRFTATAKCQPLVSFLKNIPSYDTGIFYAHVYAYVHTYIYITWDTLLCI